MYALNYRVGEKFLRFGVDRKKSYLIFKTYFVFSSNHSEHGLCVYFPKSMRFINIKACALVL